MPEANPYAAPQYPEEHPQVPLPGGGNLASLGQRFIGRLVDNLGAVAVSFVGLFTIGNGLEQLEATDTVGELTAVLVFFAYAIPFNALQWWLIVSSGQSIGKKLANTRVVREDGSPVGFTSGVVLREWVMAALSAIPVAGRFIGLVDAIAIFVNNERKTLHDRIAGTKVVDASVTYSTDAELGRFVDLGEEPPKPRKRRKKKKPADPAAFEPAPSAREPEDAKPDDP